MAMVVKNNISAKNTVNQLDKNEKAAAKDLKKLASGRRINGAADDASGYAISERMDVQIRGLEQDNANTQNGASLLKTAEGAVSSTVDILKTLKEKAINAANDTNTNADRETIQKEVNQAIKQLDENATVTYNGKTLLDGSKSSEVIAEGTYTHLTNENFADGTYADTYLTELTDKNGESLGIFIGDKITLSYVKNGETHSSTMEVVGEDDWNLAERKGVTFGDIFDWNPCNVDLNLADYSTTAKIGEDQSGNDVFTASGRSAISYHARQPGLAGQIAGLTIEVKDANGVPRKSTNTTFDDFRETIRAKNPTDDNSLTFQTGTQANQSIKVGFDDLRSYALGLASDDGSAIRLTSQISANASINAFDNAVSKALDMQTKIGAIQSRLEYTSANLTTASENTTASKSVIQDADMAKEMTEFTKHNIVTQSAQAMLAQANQSSSGVLSLLQ